MFVGFMAQKLNPVLKHIFDRIIIISTLNADVVTKRLQHTLPGKHLERRHLTSRLRQEESYQV
jgi:hypothetical protein